MLLLLHGTFDSDYLAKFEAAPTPVLKPEAAQEVLGIMKQFGSQHTS